MFLHWEEKRATIQIILFPLISHMTRTISFSFMPIKIAIFKWCCRETPFFPWKGKTIRELTRDLQYSLNSGQDLSSLWMSNLRPVLGILDTEEVKDMMSVRVSWESSLKFPMNNLFSLTTTDCQWSSTEPNPLSCLIIYPCPSMDFCNVICHKTCEGSQQTYGCNVSTFFQTMHLIK